MTMDDFSLNISSKPQKSAFVEKKQLKTSGEDKIKEYGVKRKSSEPFVPDKFKKKKKDKMDDFGEYGKKPMPKDSSNGVISSLFARNPEIPMVEESNINPIQEPVFSSETFKDLKELHPFVVSSLEQDFGITKMTEVQRMSIVKILAGNDTLVRSQTGSGKTIAYAVPMIQTLRDMQPKISRADGVRVLVVLPTRELALQTYECFVKLVRACNWIVPGILAGGEKRKSEKARIRRGINILVGTPGRLIDHAQKTKCLSFNNLQCLILDEADKLLDMGYEKDISQLLQVIEAHREDQSHLMNMPRRQTVLLSATLSPGVERLAGLTLTDPEHVDASSLEDSNDTLVVPQLLAQKYIVVPAKLRLVTLASFILRKCEVDSGSKMIIFMATQDMVDYHTDLLSTVLEKTAEFLKLHGNMSQPERTQVFKTFRAAGSGILLCTDVAARGLDLPKVDWIVQYTAPGTPEDYVHRVGRTARVGTRGSALLFITPEEMPFLEILSSKRIKLNEESTNYYLESLLMVDFKSSHRPKKGWDMESAATELQMSFEQAVIQQKNLHHQACDAFKSWARFYASYPKESRAVFSFKNVHLGHYAKSFALRDAPSTISGIGKPKHLNKNKFKKKMKTEGVEDMGRTKKLILSEFDSGLKSLRKPI